MLFNSYRVFVLFADSICSVLVCLQEEVSASEFTVAFSQLVFLCLLGLEISFSTDVLYRVGFCFRASDREK